MSALKMITVAEYFAMDRASDVKLEYYHGQVVAMAGASPNHNRISVNLITRLNIALDSRPCEVFNSDQKVRTLTSAYFYPDVIVACHPEFEGDRHEILTNPVVVFEVLSPSTEARDRGIKFQQLCTTASLREIVFLSQDHRWVDRFTRHSSGWLLTTFDAHSVEFELSSIGVSLKMDDVYRNVEFTALSREGGD